MDHFHGIEVKSNNSITNDPCAVCGARVDPEGIDAFIAGTWELVCDECAERGHVGQETGRKASPRLWRGRMTRERCPVCKSVLLWSGTRLVCCRVGCPGNPQLTIDHDLEETR